MLFLASIALPMMIFPINSSSIQIIPMFLRWLHVGHGIFINLSLPLFIHEVSSTMSWCILVNCMEDVQILFKFPIRDPCHFGLMMKVNYEIHQCFSFNMSLLTIICYFRRKSNFTICVPGSIPLAPL